MVLWVALLVSVATSAPPPHRRHLHHPKSQVHGQPMTPRRGRGRRRDPKAHQEVAPPNKSLGPVGPTAPVTPPPPSAQDSDLSLLPGAQDTFEDEPQAPQAPWGSFKFRLEDAVTGWRLRENPVVPLPSVTEVHWQNRTSADAVLTWQIAEPLSFILSCRLNVIEQTGLLFPSNHSQGLDAREGYLVWEPVSGWFLELGRINVHNGVALGSNPTDFFRARTLVDQSSLNPSVIREDRLGTAMVRSEFIGDHGAISAVYAPKLTDASPIDLESPPQPTFDPFFGHTNTAHRALLAGSVDFLDLSPQALAYWDGSNLHLGASASHEAGDSVVLYAEWAGTWQQANVIGRALSLAQSTHVIPANSPPLPINSGSKVFQNDVAAGFSWASSFRLTANVEYHFHQGGFSQQDWHNWFNLGSAQPAFPPLIAALWYVRAYAADQQEPISQHQLFVRLDWPNFAGITDLGAGGIAFINLPDGSVLAQVQITYDLSSEWSFRTYGSGNLGGGRTEHGSLPQMLSLIVQVARYF